MTTELSNGRTLWIYCDTSLFGADQRLRWFVNTSAAVATPDDPTVMHDHVDAEGMPQTFLVPSPDHPTCAPDQKASVWPQSAITIKAQGTETRDHVLLWYSNVCLVPGGAETLDVGLAEAWYETGPNAGFAPAAVRIVKPSLFPKVGPAGNYGVAAVLVDDEAFVYRCDHAESPCFVAKVDPADAADRDAYRYWDGTTWQAAPDRAAPVTTAPEETRIKPSVRWVPALERFVMLDVDWFNTMSVRVAESPEGPWSKPALVPLTECTQGYPNNCFAVEAQPQLSTPGHLAVSYFDPARTFGVEATTRLIDVPVTP